MFKYHDRQFLFINICFLTMLIDKERRSKSVQIHLIDFGNNYNASKRICSRYRTKGPLTQNILMLLVSMYEQ